MRVGAGVVVVLLVASAACGGVALAGCTAGGSGGGAGDDAGDGSAHDGTATDGATAHDGSTNDGSADGGATDAMPDSDDSGPACVLVGGGIGNATCDTCLAQKCCDKWNTCFNDIDCLDLFDCTGNCTGDAGDAGGCIYDCQQLHMGAVGSFNALISCFGGTCKTPCGL